MVQRGHKPQWKFKVQVKTHSTTASPLVVVVVVVENNTNLACVSVYIDGCNSHILTSSTPTSSEELRCGGREIIDCPPFAQQNTLNSKLQPGQIPDICASFIILAASRQDMSFSMITNTLLYFPISSLSRCELWTTLWKFC